MISVQNFFPKSLQDQKHLKTTSRSEFINCGIRKSRLLSQLFPNICVSLGNLAYRLDLPLHHW